MSYETEEKKMVALKLPKSLLRDAKIKAAIEERTFTSIMTAALADYLAKPPADAKRGRR